MNELQQILLQKLPRLSKLIFGGRIRLVMEEPLSHNHILEALGGDYALFGNFELVFYDNGGGFHVVAQLPSNISDLSLPEYEETRKQLISLLK